MLIPGKATIHGLPGQPTAYIYIRLNDQQQVEIVMNGSDATAWAEIREALLKRQEEGPKLLKRQEDTDV